MPELPEVETITQRLKPLLVNKKVVAIDQHHPKPWQGDVAEIIEQTITDVSRRAKILRIHFKNGMNILVHLKMTGQLIYVDDQQRVGGGHPTEDWIRDLPSNHTRLTLFLNKKAKLFFNDQRLFGWMRVLSNTEVEQKFGKFAPDVNSEEFTLESFTDKISNRSVAIKQLIMDTKVVSGVGNIYACDALNLAKISPFRPGKSLTKKETKTLYNALKETIDAGIKAGGATTDGKFINIDGMAGKYQLQARVYDRKGEHCKNCGGKIVKDKLGGRGTYWCPQCQR